MFNKALWRQTLQRMGLTQKQVAKEIGMSTNALSMKVNGTRQFTVLEAFEISRFLSLPSDQVLALFFQKK